MIIRTLCAHSGDVRRLLGLRQAGVVDLSDDSWEKYRSVLGRLHFDRIALQGKQVRPNFIDSTFSNCQFRDLSSEGNFWGACNSWKRCEFENLRLRDAISPQNRFEACRFVRAEFRRYQPAETVFVGCTFERFMVEGLRVLPNTRNKIARSRLAELWPFPELQELDLRRISLMFRDCHFEKPVFKNCRFGPTVFENCSFDSPRLEACDLNGTVGLEEWSGIDEQEIENAYMSELTRLLELRLGKDSWSAGRLRDFLATYEGQHLESDWFEALVENGIPDDEYAVVEGIVDLLDRQFPP